MLNIDKHDDASFKQSFVHNIDNVNYFNTKKNTSILKINANIYKKLLMKTKLPTVLIDYILLFTNHAFFVVYATDYFGKTHKASPKNESAYTNTKLSIETIIYKKFPTYYELETNVIHHVTICECKHTDAYENSFKMKRRKSIKLNGTWSRDQVTRLRNSPRSAYYTYTVTDNTTYTQYSNHKFIHAINEYVMNIIIKYSNNYISQKIDKNNILKH